MKYLIAFDIVDDKVRRSAVKILLEYGYRVQKSVFEAITSRDSIEECCHKLKKIIDEDNDSVRAYPVCKDCETKVLIMGTGMTVEETEYIII